MIVMKQSKWIRFVDNNGVATLMNKATKCPPFCPEPLQTLKLGNLASSATVFVFFFFLFVFFLRSPAISLGFTTFGWEFCVCDRFLIQPLR